VPYEVTADPAAFAYATVADATTARDRRGGGTAFFALADDAIRAQKLAQASMDLDTSDWIGERASTDQELEWPRTGTPYSDDAWPGVLVDATIELAFANARKEADDASADVLNPVPSNIKREKVSSIETEYFAPATTDATDASRWPTIVQALIASLLRSTVAAAWGVGTAVRSS
jgi:hypothetical protein